MKRVRGVRSCREVGAGLVIARNQAQHWIRCLSHCDDCALAAEPHDALPLSRSYLRYLPEGARMPHLECLVSEPGPEVRTQCAARRCGGGLHRDGEIGLLRPGGEQVHPGNFLLHPILSWFESNSSLHQKTLFVKREGRF